MTRVLEPLLLVLLVLSVQASDARAVLPVEPPVPSADQIVGGVTSIVTPASTPASTGTPSSASTAGRRLAIRRASDLEAGFRIRINAVRRRFGLRPLAQSPELTRAAVAHVDRLATDGYFSHNWPDGAPFRRWILTFYPVGRATFWSTGENLLWGTQAVTPTDAVDAWLASPEHRLNLLDARWRQIGIGIVRVTAAPGFYKGQDVAIAATEFGVRR
jgi:uncharacterized protein YkwD